MTQDTGMTQDTTGMTREAVPSGPAREAGLLLSVDGLVQEFPTRRGVVQAVSDVSFQVAEGETLGIVGETGSGKSTLARSILQAPPPKSGTVTFRGTELTSLRARKRADVSRQMQMIFQDPYTSLDPKWSVRRVVEEPLISFGLGDHVQRQQRVAELLELVGLDVAVHGHRRARELSGGQCQRVAIARALAASPSLIVADEAVSSLDVLVQAQVLNLFERLRADLGLTYLFIAHDLALVKQVSDRVAVMYLGKLCEIGPADEIFGNPMHPYTAALLAAVPAADPDAQRPDTEGKISGALPSPVHPPSGCRFRTRCPLAQARCAREAPELRVRQGDPAGAHLAACHFPLGQGSGPQPGYDPGERAREEESRA